MLIFLEWSDPSANGVLTGKLFEYLISGTPILAIGPSENSCSCKLIKESGTGLCCSSVRQIYNVLKRVIKEKVFYFYTPRIDVISRYDRRKQVERLVYTFNTIFNSNER